MPNDSETGDVENFVTWFTSKGGTLSPSVGLKLFADEDGGRGAVALQEIQEGDVLFSIPRSLVLSLRTSTLPKVLGESVWRANCLHQGWSGLILCMMWEEARGEDSLWSGYLSSLPDSFQTLMFWNDEELFELQGSYVLDKIGKAEAEEEYKSKIKPVVKDHPELFSPESHYALERFHVMGSRILSRSFHVEPWDSSANSMNGQCEAVGGTKFTDDDEVMDADMEFDAQASDNEDDEDDDAMEVSMVPMADMLNARVGSNNAKLFYEETELKMMATKSIQSGEQIWNTYGDPPNADLLRRYGHVDCVPLASGRVGNPSDVVEIRADVIQTTVISEGRLTSEAAKDRIDWWLEEDGDDVFDLTTSHELPEELTSFIRLLLMEVAEWTRAREKGRLPKPKLEPGILTIATKVLARRLSDYPTTIQDDEALLFQASADCAALSRNHRSAVIVRLGEKRILKDTLERCNVLLMDRKRKIQGTEVIKKRLKNW